MLDGLVRQCKIFLKRIRDDKAADRESRFAEVYKDAKWGEPEDDFSIYWSGSGSKKENTEEYASYVAAFCIKNAIKKVVEIGCGDFRVAHGILEKVRGLGLSVQYTGIDIVTDVIDYNRRKFADDRVDFMCLDAVQQDIPAADLYLVREVFQHLNNKSIECILGKVERNSKYAIVTELHPRVLWKPNVDYMEGQSSRNKYKTGVYLDKPPFNRKCETVLSVRHVDNEQSILDTCLMSFERGRGPGVMKQ